jgi:hypothetical protein
MDLSEAKRIIEAYAKAYDHSRDKETWFEDLKAVGIELGYCANKKDFKANPDAYRGMIADVAGTVRAAIAHRSNTPDLYTIIQIMGEDLVRGRFEKFGKLV